ncbi:hypothetical protein HPP92_016150 [Vanilla planifolia]|uniref:Uncharacterized protein n=1 Tax=Vanilla planifolia TaxID=51239 RepID=A0A835QFK8_VANPL|nr:hypothetical protein HPP92_016150 [Vanilla planifolia]
MGNGNGSETLRSTIPLPRTLLFLLLCIAWVPDTAALWINLPSSGTKCVSQEIQPNIVVLADYSLSSGDSSHDNSTISVKGVELELKKLEELVQVIHQNLLYLKSR